ncbi:DUF3047 domain-containing protein [Rubrivirga sp. IMCC45206]|uniref:DUF3047 domain-containing protein n=1 Tax=Rubrivirga sp. IMCC45206 TaxID=3391614 RepID=UPI00399038E7
MTRLRSLALALVGLAVLALSAFTLPDYVVASFSNMRPGGAVNGWEPMRLGDARPSDYRLVRDGRTTVVRADANASASGLVRRFDVDADRFPVLRWRWKVDNVVEGGDLRRKSGDDYAARIYVLFDYDPADLGFADRVKYRALRALGYDNVPVRALSYVWASQPGASGISPNPFTDWVQMIPVEAGPANVGTWRSASRDLVRDYRAAFGEAPPPIAGIAIMTDADNTGNRATAYYGDIRMTGR